jgi:hypothetical protein
VITGWPAYGRKVNGDRPSRGPRRAGPPRGRGRRWFAARLLEVATLLMAAWGGPAAGAEFLGPVPGIPFEIVVHRDHLGGEISPLQLRRIFLRRITQWPDGRPVVPVNGPPGSELREQINRWLFPEGHARLVDHWNKLYYQGILPPRALASYSAVALMVARIPGAIGYLPAGLAPPQVRVLAVTGLAGAADPRAGEVSER